MQLKKGDKVIYTIHHDGPNHTNPIHKTHVEGKIIGEPTDISVMVRLVKDDITHVKRCKLVNLVKVE